MTLNHRDVVHRIIKARQAPVNPDRPGPEGDADDSPQTPGASVDPSSTTSPQGPVFTRPTVTSTSTTVSSTTIQPPPARPTTTTTQTTTSATALVPENTTTAFQTSTTSSSSTDTSTSTTPTTTGTTPTTSVTSTLNTATTVPRLQTTTSINTLTRTASTLPSLGTSGAATPSPTESESSSGSNVGGIVGGIAGALVGIAILGFLISFIIRRWRKRNSRDSIYGDDFRQSQFISGSNSPLEPPVMGERHHSVAPSISSGPGMAGHGAFQSGAQNPNVAPGYGAGTVGSYGADPGAAGYGAAAASAAALRERPNYTYGHQQQQNYYNGPAHEDDSSEIAHGVYSAQPQVQTSYNPEAYGSYAAYDATPAQAAYQNAPAHAGYQDATRQYQSEAVYTPPGPDVGSEFSKPLYNPYLGAPAGATPGVGVATTGAVPGSPPAGAHPITTAASRDPASVSGNRSVNTRSIVQDDDVYGGI